MEPWASRMQGKHSITDLHGTEKVLTLTVAKCSSYSIYPFLLTWIRSIAGVPHPPCMGFITVFILSLALDPEVTPPLA
jgi:hypothetical protein